MEDVSRVVLLMLPCHLVSHHNGRFRILDLANEQAGLCRRGPFRRSVCLVSVATDA